MHEADAFSVLAEAVADGQPLDWASLEQSSSDDERSAIAALRHVAVVTELFATLSRTARGGSPPARLEPGSEWGGLRIVEHIGHGRFGDVYRAWDPALERHVALKLVGCDDLEGAATPVVDEGRMMARVRHSNVVTIYGAQRIGDVVGLWMELVDGRTLESELATNGRFAAKDLGRIGRDLAEALGAVHEAGLVHRDVKASNVLRDPTGRVVLGDFGTGLDTGTGAADGGGLIGTPAYVAPEVFAGEPATPRSDVYSLGVLLFHLATGEYPQPARTLRELRDAHAIRPPRRLREARPDLPSGLAAIVDRALDHDPANRFVTGADMATALAGEIDRGRDRGRLHPWVLAGAAAALVVGAGGALNWYLGPTPPVSARPHAVLVTTSGSLIGEPDLEGQLEQRIRLELADLPGIALVEKDSLAGTFELMRRPVPATIDREIGIEVIRRNGRVDAMLAASIEPMEGRYRIGTDILDADGSVVARVVEVTEGTADVPDTIARAAVSVRERLAGAIPSLPEPESLPQVQTSSLEALELFAEALRDLPLDANPARAEERLAEAVRLDPDFALAHVALATAVEFQGRPPSEALTHAEAAWAVAARALEFDRGVALVQLEHMRGRVARGEERSQHFRLAAEEVLALNASHPERVEMLPRLIRIRSFLAPAERLRVIQTILESRPDDVFRLKDAASAAVDAREFDQARTYLARARPLADRAARTTNGSDGLLDLLGLLFNDAWIRNDIDQAAALAEELDATRTRLGGAVVVDGVIPIYITLGQLNRAEALASAIPNGPNENPIRRQMSVGRVLLRKNEPARLRTFLQAESIDPRTDRGSPFIPAFTATGQHDLAREAIEILRSKPSGPGAAWMANLDAGLALAEGRPRDAIHVLEPHASEDTGQGYGLWLAANIHLADAWLAIGDATEAVRGLERVSSVPRELRRPDGLAQFGWLEVRDRLAQCYRRLGRVAEAEAIEAELRVLLRFADADHPIKHRLATLEPSR